MSQWKLTRILALAMIVAAPSTGLAQPMPADHAAHSGHSPATAPSEMSLADQVMELRTKVSKLEMELQHKRMGMTGESSTGMQPMAGMAQGAGSSMPGMGAGSSGGMAMGDDAMAGSKQPMGQSQGMPGTGGGGAMPAAAPMPGGASGGMGGGGMGMGMMKSEMGGMGGGGSSMPTGAPAAGMSGGAGMGMDKMETAGMMGMGAMNSGAAGTMPQSALPGFPGASHLYHIGATGFFLDHPQHISLTTEQQTALNRAKEQALLAKSTADRAVEQADQELWALTAADQPDAAKIEVKTREIEKLRGDERLSFIRAVGEASNFLTDEQRKILTGFVAPAMATPAPAASVAPAMAAPTPAAPAAPMSGM